MQICKLSIRETYEGHSEIFEIRANENLQNKNNGLILKYKEFSHNRRFFTDLLQLVYHKINFKQKRNWS